MKKFVINTKEQLKVLFEALNEADIFSDDEEDKDKEQLPPADDNSDASKDTEEKDSGDTSTDTDTSSAPSDDIDFGKISSTTDLSSQEDMTKGQTTVDMIVTKLNLLRSGRSLRDEHISKEMEKYFNALNDSEKLALYAFLKGISQIVTGEIPAEKAAEPEDGNPSVKISSEDKESKNQKHITAQVVKKGGHPSVSTKASPANQGQTSNKENTAPPIQVKKR